MLQIRRSEERGHFDHGWLKTYHTFSFADYHDPNFMGFRDLRVINEDWVQPHRDMEIITYVLEGGIQHKDSMGNGSVIRPGDVQRMSAGTGVTHSEFNPSKTDPIHLLQIWILPEREGLTPEYEQKTYPPKEKAGQWRLVASPDGRDGSVRIHQDVLLWSTLLKEGEELSYILKPERHAWLQVVQGEVRFQGQALRAGDGAAVSREEKLQLAAVSPCEALLFDLR
jgi:redox-sensitive bicupin YhaK (pirin superfamily)